MNDNDEKTARRGKNPPYSDVHCIENDKLFTWEMNNYSLPCIVELNKKVFHGQSENP